MAIRLRITSPEKTEVHFDGVLGDAYTLCGLDTVGDQDLGLTKAIITKQKVTCEQCIKLVEYCHLIKKKEF